MLALSALALGAWFRFGPPPPANPAPQGEAPQISVLYLPVLAVPQAPQWLGPEGGLIAAVAASPGDPQRVYAGSWGGGVYRSDDGGLSWHWTSGGLANLTVVSLAIDPANPDVLYAGTYRGGVFKTGDGGTTWSPANQGIQSQAIVYSMVVNPNNPQRVYAATRGVSNNGNQPWAGVTYRSDNAGASWSSVLANLGGSNYQDWTYMLAISRTTPSTLMAATHEHGVLRTINSGGSWTAVNTGMTNFTTRAIGIGPTSATDTTAYVGVWTSAGVFKTNDLGDSWVKRSSGINGAHIYGMDIDPANPWRVYMATYNMGVMRTSDGAGNWQNVALPGQPVSTVRVHPGNPPLVFAGTAGLGLYASRDSGANWAPSQAGLQAASATGLVVAPGNPQELFVGVDGGGVMHSVDGGLTWSTFSQNIGSPWVNGLLLQPGSSFLFAFTEGAGLYRCDLNNPGTCWQRVGGNLPTDSQVQSLEPGGGRDAAIRRPFSPRASFLEAYPLPDEPAIEAMPGNYGLLAMTFAPSNPGTAYIGSSSSGAFASSDGGVSWHAAGLSPLAVWALAVDPLDPQKVYAATGNPGAVKVSSNGGGSWSDLPLSGRTIYALAVLPDGSPLAGTDNGIYRQLGGSWGQIGLGGQTVAWLTIDPADPNHILAGTTDGAMISLDGGLTWQPGPPELAGHTVQHISLDPLSPGIAYYATTAHGVLKAGSGQ